MPTPSRRIDIPAIEATADRGSENGEQTITADRDSEFKYRFRDAARQLLPTDTGLALHYITGVSESACYRAARGENPPSLYLYRQLLFTELGETWLNVLMDGCQAPWWVERSVRERKAALFDQARHIMAQINLGEARQ